MSSKDPSPCNPFHTRQTDYDKLPRELSCVPNLSNGAFRLYCYLCTWKDAIFPSYVRIKKDTGLSKGSITSALRELGDFRMLQYRRGFGVTNQKASSGKKRSNQYQLLDSSEWDMKSLTKREPRKQSFGLRNRPKKSGFGLETEPARPKNWGEASAQNLGSTNTQNQYTYQDGADQAPGEDRVPATLGATPDSGNRKVSEGGGIDTLTPEDANKNPLGLKIGPKQDSGDSEEPFTGISPVKPKPILGREILCDLVEKHQDSPQSLLNALNGYTIKNVNDVMTLIDNHICTTFWTVENLQMIKSHLEWE